MLSTKNGLHSHFVDPELDQETLLHKGLQWIVQKQVIQPTSPFFNQALSSLNLTLSARPFILFSLTCFFSIFLNASTLIVNTDPRGEEFHILTILWNSQLDLKGVQNT